MGGRTRSLEAVLSVDSDLSGLENRQRVPSSMPETVAASQPLANPVPVPLGLSLRQEAIYSRSEPSSSGSWARARPNLYLDPATGNVLLQQSSADGSVAGH